MRAWKSLGVSCAAVTVLALGGLASVAPSAVGASTANPTASTATTHPTKTAIAPPTVPVSERVESLCAQPRPGNRACFALKLVPKAGAAPGAEPGAEPVGVPNATTNATPAGYGPTDLRSAYNLPTSGGSGVTVAIVDAYNDPTAEADLGSYRSQYGLAACTTANGCFKKVSQTGSTTALPATNTGWSGEIALDIEMVSAACPSCHILLVEASSASDANLDTAVDYAAQHATVVSNSYGGPESSSNPTEAAHYNHAGVSILASSGDQGYVTEFPAAAASVIAVGGTALSRSSATSRGWTESAWDTSNSDGAGSGCSAFETKPTWQHDTGCARRTVADVSAVADPATGVAVYDTTGGSGWTVYGGTSVASPLVAGILSVTGHAGISASYLYANPSFLYDVASGQTSTSCTSYLCKSATGYDGPTGLGTPNGALLAGGTTVNDFSLAAAPASVVAGSTATSAITTATTSGSPETLALSSSGVPSGVTVSFSPASVTSGTSSTARITVAASVAAGSYPITVTAAAPSAGHSVTHNVTLMLTVASAASGCARQLLVNPGFESGATGWTATSGVINTDGKHPRAGVGYAWLDGYGSAHTDTLAQTVAVPTGCSSLTLSFWLEITTAETSASSAPDKLTVTAGSTTVATYSNLNRSSAYVQHSITLTGDAGKSVAVTFKGVEDGARQTSFYLDDTALTLG